MPMTAIERGRRNRATVFTVRAPSTSLMLLPCRAATSEDVRHCRADANTVGLDTLKGRRPPVRNGEGEYGALAGDLPPFDVAASTSENAHRAWKVLVLLCRLAVLDDELLLPRGLPERHAKIIMFDVTPDIECVVECDCHNALYWFGTSASAALVPQLRP